MADTLPKEYYLVTVPLGMDTEGSIEYIEKRFSKCLKRQQDNIILNMESINPIERNHTNLLTKWIRNLKSLQGSLIIIGIQDDIMPLFKTSRLTSICEVFSSMEVLKSEHPDLPIIASDNSTDKVQIVQKKALENLLDDGPVIKNVEKTDEPEKSEGIAEVAGAIDSILDEGGLEENHDKPEKSASESITRSINIKNLEEMSSQDDVSDKLDFLNGPADEESADSQVIVEDQDSPVEETPPAEEGNQDAGPEPEEATDTSEVRSTEAYYNIMGDSADGGGGLEDDLLEELDDVSVDDDLFSESDDEDIEPGEEDAAPAEPEQESVELETEVEEVVPEQESVEVETEAEEVVPEQESASRETDAEEDIAEQEQEHPGPEEEPDSVSAEETEPAGESADPESQDADPETSEVRSSEAYYNIMGDSADGDGDLENDLLEELDDVSVEDDLFDDSDMDENDVTDETDEPDDSGPQAEQAQKEISSGDEQVDEEKSEEVEISESVSGPEEMAAEAGDPDAVEEIVPPEEPDPLQDEGDYLEAPIGNVNEIIHLSGEYQCLGCGELEYFLKGFKFHACHAKGCKGRMDGFHPVCVLF